MNRKWKLLSQSIAVCQPAPDIHANCVPNLDMIQVQSLNQPGGHSFPKRTFGKTSKKKCCFQSSWFDKFSWLHYDQKSDKAFCLLCIEAHQQGTISSSKFDKTYSHRFY